MSTRSWRRSNRLIDLLQVGAWREIAIRVLETADPLGKCRAALHAARAPLTVASSKVSIPDSPARPSWPLLVPPQQVEKRKLGTPQGRVSLLHALAHIELNAIDLAFDMAVRFEKEINDASLDSRVFVADWMAVGVEEASHFRLLLSRLQALGSDYGELPAHGSLWEAASLTCDSVLARLAVAPMVLEARGLDVTPSMAARLRRVGDIKSADLVDRIHRDEIGHVATGVRWFRAVCQARRLLPEAEFERLVIERFKGGLKGPFNGSARGAAGLDAAFYARWNKPCEAVDPTRRRTG